MKITSTIILIGFFIMMGLNTLSAKETSFSQDISATVKNSNVSVKTIKETLCESKSPQELADEKYEEIFKEIGPALIKLKKAYHLHSIENAKNLENKSFKIKGIKYQDIVTILKEYLNEDRKEILEKDFKLDSTYAAKITNVIIKKVYIKNLVKAVEEKTNEWLLTEEKDNYLPFLKEKALQPKIADRKKMMETISLEYVESGLERLTKMYRCLIETSKIIKQYDTGSINIKYDGKNKFNYISSLETILNGFFLTNYVKKNKKNIKEIPMNIREDVFNVIEKATNIE